MRVGVRRTVIPNKRITAERGTSLNCQVIERLLDWCLPFPPLSWYRRQYILEAVMHYRTSLRCIIMLLLSASIWYAQPHQQGTQNPTVLYFPLVNTAPELYGIVTERGHPAAGVLMSLIMCGPGMSSVTCHVVAEQTSDVRGRYQFTGAQSLFIGESYYVSYTQRNQANPHPNTLSCWQTPSTTTYTAGSTTHLGDFDIGSIDPITPTGGVVLPQSSTATMITLHFTWTPRRMQPQDQYTVEFKKNVPSDVCDIGDSPRGYAGHVVGSTGTFTGTFAYDRQCSACVPPVFGPDGIYDWRISIANTNDWGQTRGFTFTLPLQ